MAEAQVQGTQEEAVSLEGSEFTILLQKEFKPKSDEAKGAVEQAVRTLAEHALSQTKLSATTSLSRSRRSSPSSTRSFPTK